MVSFLQHQIFKSKKILHISSDVDATIVVHGLLICPIFSIGHLPYVNIKTTSANPKTNMHNLDKFLNESMKYKDSYINEFKTLYTDASKIMVINNFWNNLTTFIRKTICALNGI